MLDIDVDDGHYHVVKISLVFGQSADSIESPVPTVRGDELLSGPGVRSLSFSSSWKVMSGVLFVFSDMFVVKEYES